MSEIKFVVFNFYQFTAAGVIILAHGGTHTVNNHYYVG